MLLSSVNFVAKPKAGKSKDRYEKKIVAKLEEVKDVTPSACEECIKELEEENTIFRFPTSSSCGSKTSCNTSGSSSEDNLDYSRYPGERVTIATGDDLCLTVDQFFYSIGLRDESKSDSTCIFRKRVLASESLPNGGHVETVVFALDCDQEFYITATKNKDLELNFFLAKPSPDAPDERTFSIYYTDIGYCFIQPKLHKNSYLHHIDQSLSVQALDLNWRCPEEYFFHLRAVPEPFVRSKSELKVCTHKPASETEETDNKSANNNNKNDNESATQYLVKTINEELQKLNNRKVIIPGFKRIIPSKRRYKTKLFFSDLLFGCFCGRSKEFSTTEV